MFKNFSNKIQVRRRYRNVEIAPDEIFLDSRNLPELDTHQFEGRFERPISRVAVYVLAGAFCVFGIVFFGRLWSLMIRDGAAYAEESETNRLRHSVIVASRGVIFDRNGEELAWNVASSSDPFARRAYIEAPGFAHVLGYVQYPELDSNGFYYRDTTSGADGVEEAFNKDLGGENGLKIVETNALGDMLSESVLGRPLDGENVSLSIDRALQERFHAIIVENAETYGFSGGAGVIMDVHTGELLVMTSAPEFSPGIMAAGEDEKAIALYQTDSGTPFLNRVISGQYTPGSIIKPFLAAAALEEEIVTPEQKFLSTGQLVVPNPYDPDRPSIFKDWKAHGYVALRDAVAVSSNVYFYYIGGGFGDQDGLGIRRIEAYARGFGFGSEVGGDLPGERDGVIPNPEWKAEHFDGDDWRLGDTYITAIGQYGFQVTPLQAVRAVAAIANGGELVRPSLISGGSISRGSRETVPVSSENLEIVREGMRASVVRGTAAGLNIPVVEIAGKTGTAQIGTLKKRVHSWAVGFFPYDEPRYAFAVIMEAGPEANLVGGVSVMNKLFWWMHENAPEYFE